MLYFIRKIRQYGAFRAFQIGIARVIKNAVWIAHLGSFWVKLFLGRRHCYAFHDIAWRLPQGWAGGYAASEQSRSCALMNMDHRFDLLGSGWVGWNRSKNGVGLCLGNNDDLQLSLRSIPLLFRSSAKTLSEICGNNYSPINWCHDPIKNYTWSTGKVYLSQPTRSMLGADLKMPWEISRFNHLPMMATVAVTSTDDDEADRLASEIVAQIADFLAFNPYGFGPNWTCAMDVGIRIANWLIAIDILRPKMDFSKKEMREFSTIFGRYALAHGDYIYRNLESHERRSTNHFLADIVALIFIAVYFPKHKDSEHWLAFGAQSLIEETLDQFYEDGGNKEGSTSYHRLSAEMVYWGVALISGQDTDLKTECFGSKFVTQLHKIRDFSRAIMDSKSEVPIVGDQDSGCFMKLEPVGRQYDGNEWFTYVKPIYMEGDWIESQVSFARLECFAAALLDGKVTALEGALMHAVAKGRVCPEFGLKESACDHHLLPSLQITDGSFEHRRVTKILGFKPGADLRSGMEALAFAESGLFLLKSDRIYVCLVARKYEEGINYGHTHNDNLSINILVDGFPILFDPGTFCYTNDVIKRNEFRSSRIHNFPFLGIEQNPIIADSRYAFHLKPASSFSAGVSNFSIIACGAFSGIKCGRKVEIGENEIIISDFATKAIDESLAMPHVFSNAYGHLKVVRESYIPNWTMETNFHV